MKKILLLILCLCALAPVSAQTVEMSADIEPTPAAMVLNGNILYMTFCGKMKIVAAIDLSEPRAPKLLATQKIGHFPQGLALDSTGRKLYVANGMEISLFSVQDPTAFVRLPGKVRRQDPGTGPVDLAMSGTGLLIASRGAGVTRLDENGVEQHIGTQDKTWVRAVTADGSMVCYNKVITADGRSIPVPYGTPRKIRRLPDGRLCLANGFAGIGVTRPDGTLELTENLGSFSCYGAHVFDVAPGGTDAGGKTQFVFLAAGEIGIITADIRSEIRLITVCSELEWRNINGILRGKENLLYAADETFGLHVLEIQPDGKTLKLVTSLKLTE